jgi:two-component system response regulator
MFNTILQVEDDPNDVFLFEYAMRKAGVMNPIQVASDGQQAINYLAGAGRFADRKTFPLPCLILLDSKLPHVPGLDVLKWIRQQPGAPRVVIMMSASEQEADIAAAYRLGANGYLVKPSEAVKFQDMARAIKDFWLTHNLSPSEMNRPPPEVPMEGAVSLEIGPADLAERQLIARDTASEQTGTGQRRPRFPGYGFASEVHAAQTQRVA